MFRLQEGSEILPEGLDAAGMLNLSGQVSGTFNDSLMPLVTADVLLDEGRFPCRKSRTV